AGRALEDLAADRRVGARVAEHARPDGRELALRVAADLVVHRDRVTLGVEADRLLAREPHLDRSAGDLGEEAGLRLAAHVLLAAERAAVRDERDLELLLGDAEETRALPPVVEDALALRVELDLGVRERLGERRLGLEVGVLDPLRLPDA